MDIARLFPCLTLLPYICRTGSRTRNFAAARGHFRDHWRWRYTPCERIRSGTPLDSFANSGWLQIVGRGFAAALVGNDLIGHLLPFMKVVRAGPFDRADIDEHICAAGVRLNEPEAFRCIDI